MRINFFKKKSYWMILLFIAAGSFLGAGEKVIIILNKSLASDALGASDVKKIFLGKKKKSKSGKIKPCGLKRGDSHKDFLKVFVGKSPQQYSSFWRKIIFTGKGAPPKEFRTEEEIVKYVASTKGAIGYIKESTAHEGVEVMK